MNNDTPTPNTPDEAPGRPSFLDEILAVPIASETAPITVVANIPTPSVSHPIVPIPGVLPTGVSPSIMPNPAVASAVAAPTSFIPESAIISSPGQVDTTIPSAALPPVTAIPVVDSENNASILDQVLASAGPSVSVSPSVSPRTPVSDGAIPPTPPIVVKKNPVTPAQIMRIMWALLFVSLIFLGSFLAYIVFNPDQAKFFINFGINPADVKALLSTLVNGIFGTLTFTLSIVFIYCLFKSYLSKGNQKKRAIFIVLSVFTGMLLFSNIGFWAFLFDKIGAQDFVRPTGGVIVYDNTLLLSKDFKDGAELGDLNNLIGPITLKYDLSSDVVYARKSLDIEGYFIDCQNGGVKHEGTDPATDTSITCEYTKAGNYAPTGYYRGKDRVTREAKRVDIALAEVRLLGAVNVQKTASNYLFDATDLKKIGNLKWYIWPKFDVVSSEEAKFSVRIQDIEQNLCLEIQTPKKKPGICDRVFTINSKSESVIQWDIQATQDLVEPSKYAFKLLDLKTREGADITDISWYIWDNASPVGKDETFEYTFMSIWTYTVRAEVIDSEKNKADFVEKITIQRPLQLSKKWTDSLLMATDESGTDIIKGTFDHDFWSYRIQNIQIPQKITFNGENIRVTNPGYEVKEILWKIGGEEKKGTKIDYNFVEEKQYEILVTYVFAKIGTGDETKVTEKITIEGKSREIVPSLQISSNGNDTLDDLYATVDVKFDASASKVRSGKISQFIYDFWEGKPSSEGEAVKMYRYSIPGEYTVKLTVVKTDGDKESISRQLVIKELTKKLEIESLVSEWIVGKIVEFRTKEGTIWQLESYSWDFWDGTPIDQSPTPNHIFEKSGTFNVKLSANYVDGTILNAEKEFVVGE